MTRSHSNAGHDPDLPDWSTYTVDELTEALEGLDRTRYPERERLILAELERRSSKRPQREIERPHYLDPPDWSSYSVAELEQALEGLDRARYPEREAIIREHLERARRGDSPPGEVDD